MKPIMALFAGSLLAGATPVGLAEEFNLIIQDKIGRAWFHEPIEWDLPGVRGETVRVERDGQPIPAQIIGAAAGARVLFIVDRLEKDGTTTLRAELGKAGPAQTDLVVTEEKGLLMLANSFTAVKINNGQPDTFSPILGVRLASWKWTGGGAYDTRTAKPVGLKTEYCTTSAPP